MKYKPLSYLLFCALPFTATAQMKVSNGTSIVITSGANINLNDISLDYANSNLYVDGKLIFSGSANNQIIGNTSIKNISLSKTTGNKLSLGSNVSLDGTFNFGSGLLDLNGYDLNLGTTGSLLNETNTSFATGNAGYIIFNANLNNPSGINPGNIGVVITSPSNWGNTVIKRGNYALSDGNNQTIKRFFDITPTNNSSLNATLKFLYLDGSELNSLQESQFRFALSSDNGINWISLNNVTTNAPQNYVEVSGVNVLGRITLVNDFTTLPLSALTLSGKAQKGGVALKWLTLNEVDVSHFLTEKSYDGKKFNSFSQVGSKSNLSKDNNYGIDDRNPLLGINYYRITAVDKDGKITYSNILPVNFALTKKDQNSIYPNPTSKDINGSYYTPFAQQVKLSVISSIGRVELSKSVNATVGLNHFSFDVSILPAGAYFIQISNSTISNQLKFIKN
ncbi:MAG: T9SS type A sorting domain-containing protein [Flavobacteriales bacterium]|nr:MAG: T9SS type A sorting domain-containing protein [Flavobacteriales bacterium]